MELNLGMTGSVVIGGVLYTGNKVEIKNHQVIVDGEVINSVEKTPEIHVTVHGDVDIINLGSGVVKARNVDIVNTQSGDVAVGGNVNSLVSTQTGDIICRDITGNINTINGDIYRGVEPLKKKAK